jgi:hypothetical protein
MSDYNVRVAAFAKHGMAASDRLAERHKSMFLGVSVENAFEQIVALTRLRDSIEPPADEQAAYDIMEELLAEILFDGRLKVAKHGLGPDGRESYDYLIGLHQNGRPQKSTDPKEIYGDVISFYKESAAEFQRRGQSDVNRPTLFQTRRANDPEFLRKSNEANALRLL